MRNPLVARLRLATSSSRLRRLRQHAVWQPESMPLTSLKRKRRKRLIHGLRVRLVGRIKPHIAGFRLAAPPGSAGRTMSPRFTRRSREDRRVQAEPGHEVYPLSACHRAMNLSVTLGRLRLSNPILVASGTFGYAREMAGLVEFSRLGGIIPKTVTRQPRAGNTPPRTVETPSGLLNAIGLDNDGIDHFIAHHLPYLRTLPNAILANIAGESEDDFVAMAEQVGRAAGLAALELNLSCPNVAGGIDFAIDPELTRRVLSRVRAVFPLPLITKLTPNVTDIVPVAQAAAEAGADAVSLVNTFF